MSEAESCMKCLICLFGDEVRLRLNFIVFRPACSASRCDGVISSSEKGMTSVRHDL